MASPGQTPAKIELTDVWLRYGALSVLEAVSLLVPAGEFVAIVGPSGCGKSSLLRLLAGLERPSQGQVAVDGQAVTAPHPRRLLVFQEDALYPWRTVWQNVAFGLELQGLGRPEVARRVAPLLQAVGLAGFENYYPHQLSGGMRQRASLARAFVMDPDVLLLDEPFAALDAMTRLVLQDVLLDMWERDRKTVVLITHDIEEALYLADRVLVMSPRPGRIRRVIPVDLPRPRPRSSTLLASLKGEVLAELGLERHGVTAEPVTAGNEGA